MMSFLKWVVLVPVAAVVVIFAIANRHLVTVVFDPFARDEPSLGLTAPLFLILFVLAGLGVLLGGVATWLAGARHRRALRLSRSETDRLRAEIERLRLELRAATPDDRQPLPGLRPLSAIGQRIA